MGMYQPGSKHPKDLEFAQKAIDNLKQYSAAYPEDNKALEYLISMYLNTERFDDAIAFYQNEILKRNPKDSKAMQSLAMLYFKKGDFENGVKWLKKRLDVATNNDERAEVYYLIGVQAWDRSYNFPDVDPVVAGQARRRGHGSPQQGRRDQARTTSRPSRTSTFSTARRPRWRPTPPRSRSTRTSRTSTSSRRWN